MLVKVSLIEGFFHIWYSWTGFSVTRFLKPVFIAHTYLVLAVMYFELPLCELSVVDPTCPLSDEVTL